MHIKKSIEDRNYNTRALKEYVKNAKEKDKVKESKCEESKKKHIADHKKSSKNKECTANTSAKILCITKN